MFMLNGNPLRIDEPFITDDGTQYPSNWLRLSTAEEKAAIGITEVPDPEPYDDRFYWGPGNPKQLDDQTFTSEDGETTWTQRGLKSQWTAQIKDTAGKLLAATDWMVIRKVERNVDIPAEIATYRAAVLTECDRICAAVLTATTVEELATFMTTQNWPNPA